MKRRKNFLPTLVLAMIFWGFWGFILFKVPPSSLSVISFYLVLFLALFLSAALIFANSRRGLLLASFFIAFLMFRYFQIANWLNVGLLTGIYLSLELYFSRQNN